MIKNFIKCAIVGKVTLVTIKKATPMIKSVASKAKRMISKRR